MNTTKQEKSVKELFLGKCWTYLNDNFHKFKQSNQIKIALALVQKDLPDTTNSNVVKNLIIVRDENKTKNVAGQVRVQQEPVPRTVQRMGDRQDDESHFSSDAIQRADSEQPGNNIS